MDPCPVLIGREQEMAALRALLDAGGGVAIVSGEAGIGKSRLLREFAAEAAERGRIVLWGRPEEVAQPGPYALIVDLLESIAERGNPTVQREARALVTELVRPAGMDEQRPTPTARAVAAAIRGLLAGLGSPPLLVLEDLHWADEASNSVVGHLARAASDDKHVIVAAARVEQETGRLSFLRLSDSLRRDRVFREITLAPLTDSLVESMVNAMLGGAANSVEMQIIVRLGEGVPFFVEELARAPRDGDAIVPASVGQALRARLEGLSHECRRLLNIASLMPGAIDIELLSIAGEFSVEGTKQFLAEAGSAGLIADREGRLVFRHALIREAIVRGLISVEASRLHGRLAHATESLYSNDLERHATSLMHHYSASGEAELAAKFAVVAGEQALAVASSSEARAAFTKAMDQSRGSANEALAGLAEVEFREGNEERAATLFRKAADGFLAQGRLHDAAKELRRLAWALYGRAEPARVARILDEALEWLSGDAESASYAETIVQKGSMLAFLFNKFTDARPFLETGAQMARRLESPALLAECLDGLAHVTENTGTWEDAIRLAIEAAENARASGNAEIVGRTHNNLAIKLSCYGDPLQALDVLDLGRAHLLKGHGIAGVGALDVTNAWVARFMGRPAEVTRLISRAHSTWQRWRMHRWVLEAWAAIERNQVDAARSVVEASWGEFGGDGLRAELLRAAPSLNPDRSLLLQAELIVLLAEERGDEAAAVGRALVAIDEQVGEKFDVGHSLTLFARALLLVGDQLETNRVIDRLSSLLKGSPYPYLLASSSELEGVLLGAEGETRLLEAARQFGQLPNDLDRARCLRLAAQLIQYRGERDEAVSVLREARVSAEAAGAQLEQNRIEALMRSLGARPRAGRPRGKSSDGTLSPREAEVTVLVAGGSSNAEIGHRLFLSERTVQDHISHSLRKLHLSSRAALASWAAKRGMI